MATKLSKRELRNLLNGLESQGCTVKEIEDGFRIYPPDGGKIMTLHLTVSDHRAMKNLRSEARRGGLRWPLDKR